MSKFFVPNPKQKQAIEHTTGPMLVLAGAGTGKTSVLTERIAFLIENKHALPEEILAITFTENAAQEMKERVQKRLGRKAAISASTFHAYCHGVLKRSGRAFHVLPPEDVYVFLRQRIDQLGLERFIRPADVGEFLYDLRNFFDRCHEELIGPEKFRAYVESLQPGQSEALPRNCKSKDVDQLGQHEILARWREIARVYSNSMRLLEEKNLGTFGMQISKAVGLLQSNPELLRREQQRARFILIDEFQDCNASNITIAELLGGSERNIFAVGDPDQAIYRFRGASSAAFEEFQRRFPETQGVVLDENQRSRGNILRVAFASIDQNPSVSVRNSSINFQRRPLQSARDARDEQAGRFVFDGPVEVAISFSERQEAADIAEEILRIRQRRTRLHNSMAVLYRSHAHRERVIEELAAREIPFIVKGIDVLDAPSVRDVLAAARAVENDSDVESLFRLCAFPQFGINAEDLRNELATAANNISFKAVLAVLKGGAAVLEAIQAARKVISMQKTGVTVAFTFLLRHFNLPADDLSIQALMRFLKDWEKKPYIEANNLPAFLYYLGFFEEAGGTIPMLSEAQLAEAAENTPDAVQLMTVHGAKGLEFSYVWLLRVVASSFPTPYRESLFEFPPALRSSIAIGDGKEINEQEERRLFYVAITRARDQLTIGSRRGRGQDPTPAGFLRPLLQDKALAPALQSRDVERPRSVPVPEKEGSPVAAWMLLPPAFKTDDLMLSANSVESYSTCPMKFKLGRDWQIPGGAAAALHYGNAVHTVLKNYYDPHPNAPEQTAADVIESFIREFNKAVIEDEVQRQLYESQGRKHLEALVTAKPRGSVNVVAAEAAFRFNLGKLKLTGRIDRIDRLKGNLVRVIDYKTGSPKTQKYADESLQLSIYAMGATEMGYAPLELVLLNLNGTQEIVTARSSTQLDKARQKIEDAAEGITARNFDPKPGMHCRWCEFERLCPATEQRVLIPVQALTAGVNG